jgi:hypothetical protein
MLRIRRRALGITFALAVLPALALAPDGTPSRAEASVSIAASLDDLVARSTYVAVGTAVDRKSVWEEIGNSNRIVTYTRVDFDRTVFGKAPRSAWVRTLGGAIGKIGQSVSGEAQLAIGQRALLFLADVNGVVVVVSRAQGHFVVNADQKLGPSPDVGGIVRPSGPVVGPAREVRVGGPLEDAIRTIVDA